MRSTSLYIFARYFQSCAHWNIETHRSFLNSRLLYSHLFQLYAGFCTKKFSFVPVSYQYRIDQLILGVVQNSSLARVHFINLSRSLVQLHFISRSTKESDSRRKMLRLRVEGDLAWQLRPPVADDIDQAERWPRPSSLSRHCDPRVGIPFLPRRSLLLFNLSSFLFLFLSTVVAITTTCRVRRRAVLDSGESAADYEQVRCYCSSRVHARARQHRGTGQSRRRHGSVVPKGPPRQPGRHVPREGEWILS